MPVVDAAAMVVINLDRAAATLARFRAVNACLGPVRRFRAVEGAACDRAALEQAGVIEPASTVTDGMLGCILSHRALWQETLASGRALTVCEDDAVLAADFPGRAGALLEGLGGDWDIVLWGWNFDSTLALRLLPGVRSYVMHDGLDAAAGVTPADLAAGPARLYPLERAMGTLCYTISPAGAARLLAHCTPIRQMALCFQETAVAFVNVGIDTMMAATYPALRAHVSLPPLAVSPNDAAASTTGATAPAAAQTPPPALAGLPLEALAARAEQAPGEAARLYLAWIDANTGTSPLLHAAWCNLGTALAAAGAPGHAAAAFRHALTIDPGFPPAAHNLRLLEGSAAGP